MKELRAKIIEAVPEIETYIGIVAGRPTKVQGRSITLTDVLRAVYAKGPAMKTRCVVECDGQFRDDVEKGLGPTWNLALPLDEQSPEVIAFLSSLLLD